MKLNDILPEMFCEAIGNLDFNKLNEIRLRANQPFIVTYDNKAYYLNKDGLCRKEQAYNVSNSILNFVINRACSNSIYAFDSEIKRGYINLGSGYRMGVCGEAVTEKGEVSAIKNIASVNIRIPHEIRGCSDRIKHYIKEPISTLIIAPCGAGKTTILRDLAQSFGNYENPYAVTVIDERGEISGIGNGESAFKMNGCDIVSNCPKEYAFENVVRSMSPDVVITDEIFVKDRANLKMCVDSGVKVLASLHAENIEQATEKLGEDMKKIFDMYVILSKKVKIGEIKAIYNKNIEKIL